MFVRPFQDTKWKREKESKLRRQQWVQLWGEAGPEYRPGKVLEDKARQHPLPPIEGAELNRIANRVNDKAGGLHGLTYASLRNLPSREYDDELAGVLNECQRELPDSTNPLAAAAGLHVGKEAHHRAPNLTSITYRLWCFARRGPVQQ